MEDRRAVAERLYYSLSQEQRDDLRFIFSIGVEDGLVEAMVGFELADDEDYQEGYDDGYKAAKDEIYSREEEARDDGYSEGDKDGYARGYAHGKGENS